MKIVAKLFVAVFPPLASAQILSGFSVDSVAVAGAVGCGAILCCAVLCCAVETAPGCFSGWMAGDKEVGRWSAG